MKLLDLGNSPGKMWPWWTLFVLLLAAAFRLILLHDIPPGLAQDEVLDADIVTFIRQGRHALFFREGYGHEPLYHYWAVPFQLLFGDNVLSIRLPAVYLGLLLVALTMRWARREFGDVTAVTTGLGLAVSWWPIIFSRIGVRPILEPLLLVVTAWFWQRPWLAGLFLGLSLYSYTGARVVFAWPVLWGIVQVIAAPDSLAKRKQLRTAIIIVTLALALYFPLYWTVRSEPGLQQRVDQLAGPLNALRQGDFGPVWQMTLATLGVFSFTGDPRWTYSLPGRPFFDPVTALLFYTGLLIALFRWRQSHYSLVLAWLAITLLPSALTPQAPSTVRLVGAMPIVYLLPGLAVAYVARYLPIGNSRPLTRHASITQGWFIIFLLVAILFINGARTVQDGFLRWPQAQMTRLEHYQSVWLDMSRYYKAEPTANLVLADGFYEPIDRDSFRRNLGTDPAARWIQTDAQGAGAIVLPQQDAGENGRLYVPEFAPIHPVLLAAAGISNKPLYRSEQWPSFAVYELPSFPDGTPSQLIEPVSFAGMITLGGYKMSLLPGPTLQLVTWWQVEKSLPADLKTFTHVLDATGNIAAQHDGLDAAPSELHVGDWIVQLHLITIPETTEPLAVQVGLYTAHDQQRLHHDGTPGDVIVLTQNLFVDGK
jgi:hypothetical protein